MDERTFLHEVAELLAADERRAEGVTLAVFTELRGLLTAREADDVAAQMPTALRRIWNEGPTEPGSSRGLRAHELIGRVRLLAALPDDAEAERAIHAVFTALQHLLGSPTGLEGEAWDVFSVLPKEVKLLWLGRKAP